MSGSSGGAEHLPSAARARTPGVDGLVLPLRILGTEVRLVCPTAEVYDRLAIDWSRCLSTASDVDDAVEVSVENEAGTSPYGLGPRLTTRLTSLVIEHQTGRRLMLHASAVADDTGRVVALVGQSGAGKTTAALTLCRTRFGYVTDETVAVDDDGDVLAFPRPLATGGTISTEGRIEQRGPDELGLRRCPGELRLAGMVMLDRVEEPRLPPRVEPVPLAEALLVTTPHTSTLASLERPMHSLARAVEVSGGVVRVTYSDVADIADTLDAVLDRPALDAGAWTSVLPRRDPEDMSWALWDGTVHQAPWQDAVSVADEAVILTDKRPMRLQGIGLTVWECARGGRSLAALVDDVVSVHGRHPHAKALVRQAVLEMCAAGALVHRYPREAISVRTGSRWARLEGTPPPRPVDA